jgi:hypothetical protein
LNNDAFGLKENPMRRAALLCLLILASACAEDGEALRTLAGPSAVPSPAPPLPPTRWAISVGEEVTDTLTFHGDQRVFELTAESDGTLVARVSWERSRGLLELMLADRRFGPSTPEGSIVGTVLVVAGQQYLVRVEDGAPWDYDDLFLPFALTVSIE